MQYALSAALFSLCTSYLLLLKVMKETVFVALILLLLDVFHMPAAAIYERGEPHTRETKWKSCNARLYLVLGAK